jgi:hypothetical protein
LRARAAYVILKGQLLDLGSLSKASPVSRTAPFMLLNIARRRVGVAIDDEVICEISLHREPGGVPYAVILPNGKSHIFARRDYLFNDVAKLVCAGVYEALDREKNKGQGATA